MIAVQAPCLFFSKPCACAYLRQQYKSLSAQLCSDTLRWLTTVFLRHNCARWDFLSEAIFFSRVQYLKPSSRKSWKHLWDVACRNRSWRTINILYYEWTTLPVKNICKTSTKTWRSCFKIPTFLARAILRYFSARLSCTRAQFCSRRRSQKIENRLFDSILLENWPYNSQ